MEFAPPPPPGGMNGAGASPGAPPETSPDSVAYTPSGPPPDAPAAAPPPAPPAPAEAPRASTGGFSELGDETAAPAPAPKEVDGPSAEDVGKMKARVRRPSSSLDRAPSNWTRSTTFALDNVFERRRGDLL